MLMLLVIFAAATMLRLTLYDADAAAATIFAMLSLSCLLISSPHDIFASPPMFSPLRFFLRLRYFSLADATRFTPAVFRCYDSR